METIKKTAGFIAGKALVAGLSAGLVAKYLSRHFSLLSGEPALASGLIAGGTVAFNDTVYKVMDIFFEKKNLFKDKPIHRTVCGLVVTNICNAAIFAALVKGGSTLRMTSVQIGFNMNFASAVIWSVKFPILVIDTIRAYRKG